MLLGAEAWLTLLRAAVGSSLDLGYGGPTGTPPAWLGDTVKYMNE